MNVAVETLLTRSCDMQCDIRSHITNTGDTVIHLASAAGSVNIFNILLEFGAHMDMIKQTNHAQQTPLQLAAVNGHQDMCTRILNLHKKTLGGKSDQIEQGKHTLISRNILLLEQPAELHCSTGSVWKISDPTRTNLTQTKLNQPKLTSPIQT